MAPSPGAYSPETRRKMQIADKPQLHSWSRQGRGALGSGAALRAARSGKLLQIVAAAVGPVLVVPPAPPAGRPSLLAHPTACSEDYAASLAADAQQRAARFEQAATAAPPYAADTGALARMNSTSSTSSAGQFHLPGHQAPPPASKVGPDAPPPPGSTRGGPLLWMSRTPLTRVAPHVPPL